MGKGDSGGLKRGARELRLSDKVNKNGAGDKKRIPNVYGEDPFPSMTAEETERRMQDYLLLLFFGIFVFFCLCRPSEANLQLSCQPCWLPNKE